MKATAVMAVVAAALAAPASARMPAAPGFEPRAAGGGAEAGGRECPGDQVWSSCHTACPWVCGQPRPRFCTMDCREGCACKRPTPWHDAASSDCYASAVDCPLDSLPKDDQPAPISARGFKQPAACKGDEVFKECGTACPRRCGDPSSATVMCIASCHAACACPDPQQWHDAATGRCYDQLQDCPGSENLVIDSFDDFGLDSGVF